MGQLIIVLYFLEFHTRNAIGLTQHNFKDQGFTQINISADRGLMEILKRDDRLSIIQTKQKPTCLSVRVLRKNPLFSNTKIV